MKIILIILSLFYLVHVSANERKESGSRFRSEWISEKYKSGPFLIYNCEDLYFVCVDEDAFLSCKEERDKARHRRDFRLPCAPLKEFDHFDLCVVAQYEKMAQKRAMHFCLGGDFVPNY